MSIGSYSAADSSAWLAAMPDPVPAILSRRFGARFQIAAVSAAGLALTAGLLATFAFPAGWTYLAVLWFALAVVAGSIYVESLNRVPHVASFVDFALAMAWRTAKLILVIDLAWALYDVVNGMALEQAAGTFVWRLLGAPGFVQSASINPIQVACLITWFSPLRATMHSVLRARDFESQLAARVERSIARRVAKARRLIGRRKNNEADVLLDEATELLASLAGVTRDKGLIYHRRLVGEKIASLRAGKASDDFKADPFGERSASASPQANSAAAQANGQGGAAAASVGYEQYRDFLESLKQNSPVGWSDVAGLDDVVHEMKSAFALALAEAPKGVTIEAPRRFLMYGPPGTGKTLITAAISSGFDIPFYNLKVSDVLSKFFGESTRLISAIFQLAEEQSPAVLFFDEIESISGNRDAGGMDGEERRMISALLAELDGLKSKGRPSPVFTIAATNVPWQLDPAILSRFEKQFYIALPEPEARRRMLELHLTERGFKCQAPLDRLVQFTRGYSGREIGRLCQEAVRLMMSEANPKIDSLVDRGREAVAKYRLRVEPITVAHLNAAFKKVRPQTSADLLARFERWKAR